MKIHIKKALALFFIFFIITVLLSTLCINAFALEAPENISINDYTNSISQSTIEYVTNNNKVLLKKTGGEIIIITVNTTDDANISDYAQNIYNQWKIDSIGKGNSVLIVIAKKDKDYKAIPCKNISGALKDNIFDEYIITNFETYFSKGELDDGIISLYDTILNWYTTNYSINDTQASAKNNTADAQTPQKSSGILTLVEKILFTAVVIFLFLVALKHILCFAIKAELKKRKQKTEIITHNDIDDLINELPQKPKKRHKFTLPKFKLPTNKAKDDLNNLQNQINDEVKAPAEFAPITASFELEQKNSGATDKRKKNAYSLGIDIEKEFEDINIEDIINKNTSENDNK